MLQKVRTANALAATSVADVPTVCALDEGVSAQALVSNSVDFSANQTQTLTIDGKQYTVRNLRSETSSFSYTFDESTGVISFLNDRFEIRGQTDVVHNVDLKGANCTFYGGNLADTIVNNADHNGIYGGDGDDFVTSNGRYAHIYGEGGADILKSFCANSSIYGGDGDNVYTVGGYDVFVSGGSGNETFDIIKNASSSSVYGYGGDDTFNVQSGASWVFIEGGTGKNVLTDKGNSTSAANVVNSSGVDVSNIFGGELQAGAKMTLMLDGKEYLVHNTSSSTQSVYAKVVDGVVEFVKGNNVSIYGQSDVAHNVRLGASFITFYGGDLDDTVEVGVINNTVYGGKGNDVFRVSSDPNNIKIFGEDGNDSFHILTSYIANYDARFDGGNGDDIFYITNNSTGGVYGGSGNDTFYVYSSYNTIDCGDGDDTVIYDSTSRVGNVIAGGSGNNTAVNSSSSLNYTSGFAGSVATEVHLEANETKNITINGINYQVQNSVNTTNTFVYFYNPVTSEVILGGSYFNIYGDSDKEHNVALYTFSSTFVGGDKNDKVKIYGSTNSVYGKGGDDDISALEGVCSNIYGGDGNDKITLNTKRSTVDGQNGDDELIFNVYDDAYWCNKSGGAGNDIYRINATIPALVDTQGNNIFYVDSDKNNVSGGTGADTFYLNGNNNTIKGAGSNDYFIINGENNNVDGGTGTNLFVDNSSGTNTLTNVSTDPNSGEIKFVAVNQNATLVFEGKSYTLKNTAADGNSVANNTVKYSYNPTTGELQLSGSGFSLECSDDKEHNVVIKGSNNIINGGEKEDLIIVDSGSNNVVNGKGGNDSIIINSANNAVNGGSGNDNITLNASSNKEISGGDGADTIKINSNNNTNIVAGAGNDRITGTGSANKINLSSGDNEIVLSGNSNTITSGDGNNNISTIGNSNTITVGNGKNTLGIQGDTNTMVAGDGKNEFNIYGNSNNATSGSGDDVFEISGNKNTLNAGAGKDNITVSGDQNKLNGNEDNDRFTVESGNRNEIDGNEGDNNLLVDNGVDTIAKNVKIYKYEPVEIRLQVGANENDFIKIALAFDSENFSLDFTSAESSAANIETIDAMMRQVNQQLANIGAVMNRLESVMTSQNTTMENYMSAHSAIMDADIAEETAKYTRAMILQQTTSALMAQTKNFESSLILKLIG